METAAFENYPVNQLPGEEDESLQEEQAESDQREIEAGDDTNEPDPEDGDLEPTDIYEEPDTEDEPQDE